jgi:Gluconate 2-dehydrogenase subunit 3
MAYDRRHDGYEVASASRPDFRLEVGHAPVPVGQPRGFSVLDPCRAEILRAWVAALIPARGARPAASDVGAAEYIDATVLHAPRLRAMLLDSIDRLERMSLARSSAPFAQADARTQTELLLELEASAPESAFGMVLAFCYEAYYAHPRILSVLETETGWRGLTPVFGSQMEPLDETRLDTVRSRPARYQPTPP